MASTVHYLKINENESYADFASRLGILFDAVGIKNAIEPQDFVALKMHFGERGNKNQIDPVFVREAVKQCGTGTPYVTDTNTLYVSARSNAVVHLKTAAEHGYTLENLGAPVIIADGVMSKNVTNVPVDLKHFKAVSLASDIVNTDVLIALTHVTGHLGSGMGASIKNLAMGCASRSGKQQMHSSTLSEVTTSECTACGRCLKFCPEGAISLVDNAAKIDANACVGCAECVVTCRFGAIAVSWTEASGPLQEKLAEYAYGVLQNKKGKSAFFNFILGVTRNCDCLGHSEPNVCDDLGIVAGTDPVAVDKATLDLINENQDKNLFKELWPQIDCARQIEYGAEIGLGSLEYTLSVI